ncbi:MAG: ABC transporter substrate-binding protein [Acidobacteria bacterium]|nr:ABC transporter substrate-binding protein [Acidobacteriota bacterium]MCA1612063.1 ABC transporter substrate-binding protein [Acidobacteriota bacterium]
MSAAPRPPEVPRERRPVRIGRRLAVGALLWTAALTGAHMALNVDWSSIVNQRLPPSQRKLNVAYIPVTCHLACPVTDFISRYSLAGNLFIPRMFQGFPEIKEALISNRMQVGFMVAPMAIALRAQGVPIRIVYLGHRYGSAVVVQKDGPIQSVKDLRGRIIAIPSRFSDERLIVFKALKANGIPPGNVRLIEMAPPDVAGALAAKAIDAFSMGEPYPAQAEIGGFGRILFPAREYWPDYMSCVVVVRQDVIDTRPDAVQVLVDGIARSGLWLDEGKPHREHAADFVGRYYYRQPPALLRHALTMPLDRVTYTSLSPRKPDFDMVRDLMIETGVLDWKIPFSEYVDTRFADAAGRQTAWKYEPGSGKAE